MRTIKFRAQHIDTGEWLYGGGVVELPNGVCLLAHLDDNGRAAMTVVRGDTVGEYIGRVDSVNVDIYEGDIVHSHWMPDSPIQFQRGSFNAVYADGSDDEWESPLWRYSVEVIGNIYDNPELLAA